MVSGFSSWISKALIASKKVKVTASKVTRKLLWGRGVGGQITRLLFSRVSLTCVPATILGPFYVEMGYPR